MIFVTVGTTDFDALVVAADRLASDLEEQMIIQVGHGHYEPRHARWFRFEPTLDPYYESASLVITHGGFGTLTEVLQRGLRLVGVSNPDRYDRHQEQILQAFEEAGHLVWCRELSRLAEAVRQAQQVELTPYRPPPSQIQRVIQSYLDGLSQ